MISILVVDDHAVIREGLRKILGMEPDLTVSGTAKDANEAMQFLSGQQVDVLLLDISMPGRNGLDVICDLKALQPGIHIIMLSMYKEDHFTMRAFKAGASGYLTKDLDPSEIIFAIRHVHAGGKYFPAGFAEKLVDDLTGSVPFSHGDLLSNREFIVMRMIVSGKSLNDIASSLSLNNRTVSTYKSRILKKLKLKSNAELIRYVLDKGILDS